MGFRGFETQESNARLRRPLGLSLALALGIALCLGLSLFPRSALSDLEPDGPENKPSPPAPGIPPVPPGTPSGGGLAGMPAPAAAPAVQSAYNSKSFDGGLAKNCSRPDYSCGECETKLQEDFNALLDDFLEFELEGGGPGKWNEATTKGGGLLKGDRTIEAFLHRVSKIMRANNPAAPGKLNMMVLGRSDSVQAATPGFPRVALKSPDGELWVTFSTDPRAAGYYKVEVMRWDGKKGRYLFQEIVFPDTSQAKDEDFLMEGPFSGGHADLTGKNCLSCHKSDPRPNWDTYRAWAGVIPPRDDMLELTVTPATSEGHSKETSERLMAEKKSSPDVNARAYFNFMEKIVKAKASDRPNRLKILDVPSNREGTDAEKLHEMRQQLHEKGFYRVPHFPPKDKLRNQSIKTATLAGPAHLAFDQLMGQQACHIATTMKNNPNWDKFKYGVAGLLFCDGGRQRDSEFPDLVRSYMPASQQRRAEAFFSGLSGKGKGYDAVYADTLKSHKSADLHKQKRHLEYMADWLERMENVNPDWAYEESSRLSEVSSKVGAPYTAIGDPGGVRGVAESDTALIAGLRLLLEPLGVKVPNWSMQLGANVSDTATFAFSDQLLASLADQRVLWEVWAKEGMDCNKLREKSREALNFKESGAPDENINPDGDEEDAPVSDCRLAPAGTDELGLGFDELLTKANRAAALDLRQKAEKLLEQCAACHGNTYMGYTYFPLEEGPEKLRQWLKETNPRRRGRGDGRRLTWAESMQLALGKGHALEVTPPINSRMPPHGWPKQEGDAPGRSKDELDNEKRRILSGYFTALVNSEVTDNRFRYSCRELSDIAEAKRRGGKGPVGAADSPQDDVPGK